MDSVLTPVLRSKLLMRLIPLSLMVFWLQCRGLETRGVADRVMKQPDAGGPLAEEASELAQEPPSEPHQAAPELVRGIDPSSSLATVSSEPRVSLDRFRGSRILQGHWRSVFIGPANEGQSDTTSVKSQGDQQGAVLISLVPFRDYGETLVYKGYVRQFSPGTAEYSDGGQLLSHFYVPMISVSAGGKSIQFASFSSNPWQLSKLEWAEDGAEGGSWLGEMVDPNGVVIGEVRLAISPAEQTASTTHADNAIHNCFAGSDGLAPIGENSQGGLVLERIRVGDPEARSRAWPQLDLVQTQAECRDTTQCDLETAQLDLLPLHSRAPAAGHPRELGSEKNGDEPKTTLASASFPGKACLSTPEVRLAPDVGFPRASVEWDAGGVYYGHLYHEALQRYQWVRLRTIGSEIDKRRYVSGTMTMFFGEMEDNLFIVQRFTPQRVFSGGQAFAFDGEKSEAYLLVNNLRADQIEASYYSKNYGYIGPIRLWRQGMIKPSEPYRIVARPISPEIRSDCQLNLEMESASVSGYYNLFESISTRGALNCPTKGNFRVNGLWYDYYKGIAVLRQGPASVGIYHHATHTLLLP